ncbi:Hypothetical predicted protein [Marmota monax]|uniref:Guanylate-binding protein/Atlastin C-terminal domain-containing protein n=1 Tax=Marmota monax TaxID=9995 RepID=A0A5E4CZ03_MARMO|nr:Hypothetical predicted protein [Marmota monax]
MEEARAKAEAAKAEAESVEEIRRHMRQMMEEKERLHQQQLRQIEIERAKCLAQQQLEQERHLGEEAEKLKLMHQAEMARFQDQIQHIHRTMSEPQAARCIIL